MADFIVKEQVDKESLINSSEQSGKSIMPKTGDIIPFAGPVEKIPAGWVLCDGNNGSPDLRGYFVVGAQSANNVGQTHGSNDHTHTINVGSFNITNNIANQAHGYNSFNTGTNSDGLGSHSHGTTINYSTAGHTSNLLANSTNAGGPIAFSNRPHSHGGGPINLGSGGADPSHGHGNVTVNLNTGGSHSANHSVSSSPSGNAATISGKSYPPFIIMNYIMKV